MSLLRISSSGVFQVGTSVLYHIHLNHFAHILKIDYNSSLVIGNAMDLNLQYPFSYLLSNQGKNRDVPTIFRILSIYMRMYINVCIMGSYDIVCKSKCKIDGTNNALSCYIYISISVDCPYSAY